MDSKFPHNEELSRLTHRLVNKIWWIPPFQYLTGFISSSRTNWFLVFFFFLDTKVFRVINSKTLRSNWCLRSWPLRSCLKCTSQLDEVFDFSLQRSYVFCNNQTPKSFWLHCLILKNYNLLRLKTDISWVGSLIRHETFLGDPPNKKKFHGKILQVSLSPKTPTSD